MSVVIQVCRLSSDEVGSPPTGRKITAGDVSRVAAASPRLPSSSSCRSSSTGSDAPSSNGPFDDTAVFSDNGDVGLANQHVVMNDRRPSMESAPPVPPPRRCAVLRAASGDVWQRQIVRPATDGVQRRVLAAVDSGPSSAPNSCPSSPLLDSADLRRAAVAQDGVGQSQIVGGRSRDLPPSQNDRGTAGMGPSSAPITRRTKLPLSPLVRTAQRDVR